MGPEDITVLTLTIPGREKMLERNRQSVRDQTVGPVHDHLVDDAPGDVGVLYNGLVERATTEWVCLLDDDNWLEPHHMATIITSLQDPNVDVVYSWDSSGSRPRVNVNDWSWEYIEKLGQDFNWLDTSCAVRRSAWLAVAGMPGPEDMHKDWTLCRRLVRARVGFRCCPTVTWRYTQWLWDGHVVRDPEGLAQQEIGP